MDSRGSVLLETLLAVMIMTVVGVALIAMIERATVVSLKARQQSTCERMAQTGFARLRNIDFYHVFDADSAQADYGLQAAYSYRGVLDGLRGTLNASRFDRFRIQVAFMRRDTSDANANGMTSDLLEFADAGGDLIDDYDSNIRFLDQNGDGDFFDTYLAGGRTVAEQPDTHIKRVRFEVYRRGELACGHSELVSLEQFTGDPNPSSEAALALLISTPANAGYSYSLASASQSGSWNLAIAKAYPSDIARYRADAASPFPIAGETDPLADVNVYVGGSGVLAAAPADGLGAFAAAPAAVTAALVEGANMLRFQASKDGYTSPVTERELLHDVNPPSASGATPTGSQGTRSPYVAVALADAGLSTTAVSGICPDVISLRANGADASFSFAAGMLVWIDSTTGTVPVLAPGAYAMVAETGDYAGYKTSATWSFTVAVPATDNSAPAISNKSPIGMAGSTLPELSVRVFDNQSGIIPASIVLRLDGAIVVDSANVGSHYDAATGYVRYVPGAAFASGSGHTLEIAASHWADDPLDKVTSTDSWFFTVP
ncbi:MAG: hypothetical protein Q8T11_10225 [Elusimicrobiota bacterium]|nr:hypothetical protein [Elusimicrobiota bacterium]